MHPAQNNPYSSQLGPKAVWLGGLVCGVFWGFAVGSCRAAVFATYLVTYLVVIHSYYMLGCNT